MMLKEAFSILCVVMAGAYIISLFRLHGAKRALALTPAPAACAALMTMEVILTANPDLLPRFMRALLICQFITGPAWFLYSIAYARDFSLKGLSASNKLLFLMAVLPLPFIAIMPPSSFYYQTDFSLYPQLFLEPRAFFLYLHLILILLLAVGNLESTLRNSNHSDRWRIKLSVVGSGLIPISLALFYSQGLAGRVVDMTYLPLRSFGVFVGLALMLHAEWRRDGGKVKISRRVAFRSVAVIIAGLYLLGLGLASELAPYFSRGSDYQVLVACSLIFGLSALLLVLSQSIRRKFSIWLQKNLYGEKYDYRGQWMSFNERLSGATDRESLFRAVMLSFCDTFGFVGAVFVSPPDSSGRCRAIYYEVEPPDMSDFTGMEVMFSKHPSPAPALPAPLSITPWIENTGASLTLPIHAADGPEGLLLLCRPMNDNEDYDIEDYELMEAMGRQAGLCARSLRLGDELVAAREMEALGRLGAFVLHDLKNQVYALSLLTENARRFITQPDFQEDMLETLSKTVAEMKILTTQLAELPKAGSLRLQEVDLHDLARKSCGLVPGANLIIKGEHVTVNADAEQMGKVLVNLCLNAVEAGGDKPIKVEITREEVPVLRISDQGGGIAESIINKGLFTPFNSTKKRGMGIGLYHSQKIVEAHKGKIMVENRPGRGCTFIVRFNGEYGAEGATYPHAAPSYTGSPLETLLP